MVFQRNPLRLTLLKPVYLLQKVAQEYRPVARAVCLLSIRCQRNHFGFNTSSLSGTDLPVCFHPADPWSACHSRNVNPI